jgi:hypothetical protein
MTSQICQNKYLMALGICGSGYRGVRYPTKTDIRYYPVSCKNLPDIYRIVLELLLRFCERNGPLSFLCFETPTIHGIYCKDVPDTAVPNGTG